MAKICILKSEYPNVRRTLDLIYFTPEKCELVVIKPDIHPASSFKEETTDIGLIEQVLKIYEGLARCAVVGNDGQRMKADECFERSGIKELCEKYGADTVNLNNDVCVPVNRDYRVLKNFKMPTTILKADVFINMPKMKTHRTTNVSLGLMNIFDLISGRGIYHPQIAESICDLMNIRKPDINIMDGVIGMEGTGPRRRPKRMDLILTGRDTVALDTIACRVMGINPANVEHIVRAGYYGLGEYAEKNIKIVGRSIEDARDRFEY